MRGHLPWCFVLQVIFSCPTMSTQKNRNQAKKYFAITVPHLRQNDSPDMTRDISLRPPGARSALPANLTCSNSLPLPHAPRPHLSPFVPPPSSITTRRLSETARSTISTSRRSTPRRKSGLGAAPSPENFPRRRPGSFFSPGGRTRSCRTRFSLCSSRSTRG